MSRIEKLSSTLEIWRRFWNWVSFTILLLFREKNQDWKFGIWIPSMVPVPHHRTGMPIAIDCSTVFAEHLSIWFPVRVWEPRCRYSSLLLLDIAHWNWESAGAPKSQEVMSWREWSTLVFAVPTCMKLTGRTCNNVLVLLTSAWGSQHVFENFGWFFRRMQCDMYVMWIQTHTHINILCIHIYNFCKTMMQDESLILDLLTAINLWHWATGSSDFKFCGSVGAYGVG